jgi:hypothetical protein
MEKLYSISEMDFDDLDSIGVPSASGFHGDINIKIEGGGGSIGGHVNI